MRTDHVTAWMIHQWLQQHAPDIAVQWPLQVDDQVRGVAARMMEMLPDGPVVVTGQHLLARTVIKQ